MSDLKHLVTMLNELRGEIEDESLIQFGLEVDDMVKPDYEMLKKILDHNESHEFSWNSLSFKAEH